jgi:hypothetical protein
MIALYVIGGLLIGGFIFTIAAGRYLGAFDYTPKYDEVSPQTLKYALLVIWPFVLLLWILEGLWALTGWFFKALDRGFNRLAGLDKRR